MKNLYFSWNKRKGSGMLKIILVLGLLVFMLSYGIFYYLFCKRSSKRMIGIFRSDETIGY